MAEDKPPRNSPDLSRRINNPPPGRARGPPDTILNRSLMSFTPVPVPMGPPPLAHFHPPAVFYPLNMPNLNPPLPQFYRSHWSNPYNSSSSNSNNSSNNNNNNNYYYYYLTNFNYRPYSVAHPPPILFQDLAISLSRQDHRFCDHHTTSGSSGSGHIAYSNYGPSRLLLQNQRRSISSPVTIQQLNNDARNRNDVENNLDRIFPIVTTPGSSISPAQNVDDRIFEESLAASLFEEELVIDVETVPGLGPEFPGDMPMTRTKKNKPGELKESPQSLDMNYDSDSDSLTAAVVQTTSGSVAAISRCSPTPTKANIQTYDTTTQNRFQRSASKFKREPSQEKGAEAEESQATTIRPKSRFKLVKRN